jgi:CheY-like chemotaxis protein
VQFASAALPQLILLDIMLPDIDGYEVCRELRIDPRTSHIPIIFLSQKDDLCDKSLG